MNHTMTYPTPFGPIHGAAAALRWGWRHMPALAGGLALWTVLASALVVALVAASGVASTEVRRSASCLPYVTGGVTPKELKAIASRRAQFSFARVARSSLSGGPVADAQVRISDARSKVVLDAAMDGPWLLVSMVPGRYQVAVTFQDETLRSDIEIPASGQRELEVRFRSASEVSLYPAR